MRGVVCAFDGLVRAELVRAGESRPLLPREGGNYMKLVYSEMLIQVCRDYPGIPDPRTMRLREIRFFYEGLRQELIAHTKG